MSGVIFQCSIQSARKCCHIPSSRRRFSQVKPKPLARLHESHHRDLDAALFSRVSSYSSSNSKGTRNENVLNEVSSGPETIGGGDHKPPDERVLRLGKSMSDDPCLARNYY